MQYTRDGCAVIPNFLSTGDIAALKAEYSRLVDEMDPNEYQETFTTEQSQVKSKDDYFLESGDKIRYFFEKDVFDPNGKLTVPKHLALNKVGHALHAYSTVCKRIYIRLAMRRDQPSTRLSGTCSLSVYVHLEAAESGR